MATAPTIKAASATATPRLCRLISPSRYSALEVVCAAAGSEAAGSRREVETGGDSSCSLLLPPSVFCLSLPPVRLLRRHIPHRAHDHSCLSIHSGGGRRFGVYRRGL